MVGKAAADDGRAVPGRQNLQRHQGAIGLHPVHRNRQVEPVRVRKPPPVGLRPDDLHHAGGRQPFDREVLAKRRGVIGMAQHHRIAHVERPDRALRPVPVAIADVQIDPRIRHPVRPHRREQLDLDLRIQRTKGVQPRRQDERGKGDGGPHTKGCLALDAKQPVGRLFHLEKGFPERLRIGLSDIGQRHTLGQALEQLGPQPFFQQPDLLADGGRGQMKLVCRRRERAVTRRGIERAQPGDMGQFSHADFPLDAQHGRVRGRAQFVLPEIF